MTSNHIDVLEYTKLAITLAERGFEVTPTTALIEGRQHLALIAGNSMCIICNKGGKFSVKDSDVEGLSANLMEQHVTNLID